MPGVGFVLHRPLASRLRRPGPAPGHLVHGNLPGAARRFRVGRGHVGPGDLAVKGGLAKRLVLCVEKRVGFGLVLCAEALLFVGGGVLAIENARAAEQDESRFHG